MSVKLDVLNDALSETGNNLVEEETEQAAEEAGSDEWKVGSRCYDRALKELLESHPWTFATETEELDQLDEDENPSQVYEYAYEKPAECLFLSAVFWNGKPIDYEIVGNKICTDFDNSQYPLMAKSVKEPDEDEWPANFMKILRKRVEAGLLRGLNDDFAEARNRDAEAEVFLAQERSRVDRQTPRRTMFRSRMLAKMMGR